MDKQNEATSDQNEVVNEDNLDLIENPSLSMDKDGEGLTNRIEGLLNTNSYSTDTGRDQVSNLQSGGLGTDSNSPDVDICSMTSPPKMGSNITQPFNQNPSPFLNTKQWQEPQDQAQLPSQHLDPPNKDSSKTDPPPFIAALCHSLQEQTNLEFSNATVLVRLGSKELYQGTFQRSEINILTPDDHDLLQKSIDNPIGLKGELLINVNEQTIFHILDGELKIDSLGLAGKQQLTSLEVLKQAQTVSSPPTFDAPAAYNRYQQQSQAESTVPATPGSIDAYERIAQKALNDRQPREQVKQVLKLDPFHQTLAQCLGEEAASRFTDHLLNSLADQAKTNSLSPIANTDNPVAALESRVKNLESFNQHLSSQVEILSQKLEKLSQSKAFWSHSPGLNQFLGNVRDYVANTWLAARNSLRQKAGEVSLALVGTLALASTERFGEPTSGGNRVIDSCNGKRLSISREGDIKIGQTPQLQPASEYQRLLQGIDPKLPPSLQAKQIATSALKEKFTTPQIQSILSQSPKFKEIASKQGADKALQFVNVTLAAATRQNAIESQPQPQRSSRQQSQHQV